MEDENPWRSVELFTITYSYMPLFLDGGYRGSLKSFTVISQVDESDTGPDGNPGDEIANGSDGWIFCRISSDNPTEPNGI
jgi:hypothetical protein